jgi:hypothetical protein
MEEKLQAGMPSSGMLIFALVWAGIIAYASLRYLLPVGTAVAGAQ